ncbi:reverse transcriptase domain-containing protein [Flavipsychrobacter stenotrophus]|nr:reverse transcriptase domain-containing protein [Flavipsychrobacter stenotrophus]
MENLPNIWLKTKGYLHITAQIDVEKRKHEILKKVLDPNYVSTYAFYPLIHSIIKERKYKAGGEKGERAHVHIKDGKHLQTAKARPLHYATHLDAIIFGCYAEKIQIQYEIELSKQPQLSESIIAYRKLPLQNEIANKSTIHFANEVFTEVKRQINSTGNSVVLAFDIKNFFPSLDHNILKGIWAKLFSCERLPPDHYNVFKAATQFSYIMLDDLRMSNNGSSKLGYNEKELAKIRNIHGVNAFFESPKHFRDKIKSGEIKLHKYPFRNIDKQPVGIPQGLPISATLANLYLLDFDKAIIKNLVEQLGCFYRRYSDDIIVICTEEQSDHVNKYVTDKMTEFKVEISKAKTEKFHFSRLGNDKNICIKTTNDGKTKNAPLVYLGFEFNGNVIRIKSANLAKFYRRMIDSVRRKAKRAIKQADKIPGSVPIVFRRQLYKLYTTRPLSKTKVFTRHKRLVKNAVGEFRIVSTKKKKLLRSNYLSYARRASEIMNEPAITKQIRNHHRIFNQAIKKHLKR